MDTITFDLPGSFASSFEGTALALGQGLTTSAHHVLHAAFRAGKHISRGRGYTRRLAIPKPAAREVLLLLREHAEAMGVVATDAYNDVGASKALRQQFYWEMKSAEKVLDQISRTLEEHPEGTDGRED